MVILGLTGSIGMGKSTTAKMFEQQGVSVHDADAFVHSLYAGGPVVDAVEKMFPGCTDENGVDRKKLGALVLQDAAALDRLERFIHPFVQKAERQFLEKCKAENSRLVVLDIPLLFETGANKRVDKILVVTAPPDIQRERVMARPSMTAEKFNAILAKQTPDHEKREKADFIIDTSLGLDAARKQVTSIIEQLSR